MYCYACVSPNVSSAPSAAATCHDVSRYCDLMRISCGDGLQLQYSDATLERFKDDATTVVMYFGDLWYVRTLGATATGAALGLLSYCLQTRDSEADSAAALKQAAVVHAVGSLCGYLILAFLSYLVYSTETPHVRTIRADDLCERLIPSGWFPLARTSDDSTIILCFFWVLQLGFCCGACLLDMEWDAPFKISRIEFPLWMKFTGASLLIAALLFLFDTVALVLSPVIWGCGLLCGLLYVTCEYCATVSSGDIESGCRRLCGYALLRAQPERIADMS